MTLNKKRFIALAAAVGVVIALGACSNEMTNNEISTYEETPTITETVVPEDTAVVTETAETENVETLTQEQVDQAVINYFTGMQEELDILVQDAVYDGTISLDAAKEKAKEISVTAWDFKNGYTDINGIYYSDLSENAKMIIDGMIGLLGTTLDMIAPNLGQNLQNLVGEDVVNAAKETGDSLLELGDSLLNKADESTNELINTFRK